MATGTGLLKGTYSMADFASYDRQPRSFRYNVQRTTCCYNVLPLVLRIVTGTHLYGFFIIVFADSGHLRGVQCKPALSLSRRPGISTPGTAVGNSKDPAGPVFGKKF